MSEVVQLSLEDLRRVVAEEVDRAVGPAVEAVFQREVAPLLRRVDGTLGEVRCYMERVHREQSHPDRVHGAPQSALDEAGLAPPFT